MLYFGGIFCTFIFIYITHDSYIYILIFIDFRYLYYSQLFVNIHVSSVALARSAEAPEQWRRKGVHDGAKRNEASQLRMPRDVKGPHATYVTRRDQSHFYGVCNTLSKRPTFSKVTDKTL